MTTAPIPFHAGRPGAATLLSPAAGFPTAVEDGRRVLFFSGGSALAEISRELKTRTANSVHLVTPFDSGGSSQTLRAALNMPAVGDLRARLLALAEDGPGGQPEVCALMAHRLPPRDSATMLPEVALLRTGLHPLILAIAPPTRQLVVAQLRQVLDRLPDGFDFGRASLGNLVLAGAYLAQGRRLGSALAWVSALLGVQGVVRAVAEDDLQIGADLRNGQQLHSQRLITGKEVAALDSPVTRLFISDGGQELPRDRVRLGAMNRQLIAGAEVICYPPGSLYSSVVSNLLPAGVGRAIAASAARKLYIPALGHDPEALGHDLSDQVAALLAPLQADLDRRVAPRRLLSEVICDLSTPGTACARVTARFGIPCRRLPLAQAGGLRYDPQAVTTLLTAPR